MMFPSINSMSATADSTAVRSDELPMSATSISDDIRTDSNGTLSDTISPNGSYAANVWQSGIFTIIY